MNKRMKNLFIIYSLIAGLYISGSELKRDGHIGLGLILGNIACGWAILPIGLCYEFFEKINKIEIKLH